MTTVDIDLGAYQLGWSDEEDYVYKPEKGLTEQIIRDMSRMKKDFERRSRPRSVNVVTVRGVLRRVNGPSTGSDTQPRRS